MYSLKAFKTFTADHAGFTLVEVLVSLTIMSFMMVSIYNIVDSSVGQRDRIVSEDQDFLQVYLALDRIDKDLSLLYSPLYYDQQENTQNQTNRNNNYATTVNQNIIPANDFYQASSLKGHPIPVFTIDSANEITFFTSSHRRFLAGQRESRFAWVKYFLGEPEEGDPKDTSRLFKQTITQNIYDPEMDLEKARATLLLKGVRDLKFLYWDARQKKWSERYEFATQRPPFSIKVILEWVPQDAGEEDEPQVFEQVVRPYWPSFMPEFQQAEPTPAAGQANDSDAQSI